MNNSEDISLDSCDAQDNLGYLIAVLKPYIEERVTIPLLIPQMPCMRDLYHRIFEIKNDRKQAADIFFKYLKETNEPGKYQQLLSALEEQGYSLVVDVIKDGNLSSSDEDNRRLIELFIKRLAETITPDAMAEELLQRQIIAADEAEKIRKISKNESLLDAALYLLNRIHCRKNTWYTEFLEVLWDMNHCDLVKDIDSKFYTKKRQESSEDSMYSGEPSIEHTHLVSDTERPLPSFHQGAASSGLLSSSGWLNAPPLSERNCSEGSSRSEHFQSAPEHSLMQEILTQLTKLSHQMMLQTDSIAQVSDRVLILEKKVDQILEKL
ncbi:hypothetical protein RRG08_000136 [Elysia crispata]|uniref:CARD domain-containing protein n=1 Tax=Elysia crispata TaxID=231223 RepID=A0AAE1D515_9GAST|nr:hypothetical protein RRG08_000136 [Elysia crispata]